MFAVCIFSSSHLEYPFVGYSELYDRDDHDKHRKEYRRRTCKSVVQTVDPPVPDEVDDRLRIYAAVRKRGGVGIGLQPVDDAGNDNIERDGAQHGQHDAFEFMPFIRSVQLRRLEVIVRYVHHPGIIQNHHAAHAAPYVFDDDRKTNGPLLTQPVDVGAEQRVDQSSVRLKLLIVVEQIPPDDVYRNKAAHCGKIQKSAVELARPDILRRTQHGAQQPEQHSHGERDHGDHRIQDRIRELTAVQALRREQRYKIIEPDPRKLLPQDIIICKRNKHRKAYGREREHKKSRKRHQDKQERDSIFTPFECAPFGTFCADGGTASRTGFLRFRRIFYHSVFCFSHSRSPEITVVIVKIVLHVILKAVYKVLSRHVRIVPESKLIQRI